MMKLTRRLMTFGPEAAHADFLERALFNHSLAQINPATGVMAYHVSVGQGVRRDYQGSSNGRINTAFTCCVGTGMENPALYGEGMYVEAGDKLWVNFYAPSTAEWVGKGASLKMETDMPEGETAKVMVTMKSPGAWTLALRRPAWTPVGFDVMVTGETGAPRPGGGGGSGYVEVARTWTTGDVVELRVPKTLRPEPTPDDPTLAAVMWGPLVLAQDLGTLVPARGGRGAAGAAAATRNLPAIVASGGVSEWLTPAAGEEGKFKSQGRTPAAPGEGVEMTFVPLYRLHDRTYSVYMSVLTPEAWAKRTEAGATGREP
jgi:DUF1680 family protein